MVKKILALSLLTGAFALTGCGSGGHPGELLCEDGEFYPSACDGLKMNVPLNAADASSLKQRKHTRSITTYPVNE